MTLDEKKRERAKLYRESIIAKRMFERATALLESVQRRYEKLDAAYRRIEMECALCDGRCIKLPEAGTRKKSVDIKIELENLTDEQRIELAELLGEAITKR